MTTKISAVNIETSSIETLGTLTSLTIDGVTTLGTVGNVKITGGSTGQYLTTDGTGNLSFQTVTISEPLHPFLLGGM